MNLEWEVSVCQLEESMGKLVSMQQVTQLKMIDLFSSESRLLNIYQHTLAELLLLWVVQREASEAVGSGDFGGNWDEPWASDKFVVGRG